MWKYMCKACAFDSNDKLKNENMRCELENKKLESELKFESKNYSLIKSECEKMKLSLELK